MSNTSIQAEALENTNDISESNENKKGSLVKNIARVGISLIAFFCLVKFGKVDIKVAFKYLLKVDPVTFSLAFISYLFTLILSGVRSHTASRPLGFNKKVSQLVQLNFVGTFFNNFLPTTFGGDAVRGYYLTKGSNLAIKKAIACIFYERYTGLIVLFWVSSATFILQDLNLITDLWKLPIEFKIFSHFASFCSIFIVPFLPQINKVTLGEKHFIYTKFIEPFLVYWNDKKMTLKILFLSILLQVGVVSSHIFIAKSLGLTIPLSYYFVFYPLTTIAGFIIPSLNGLGVREGSYIFFLKKVNIGSEQALAFSICWLIILLITSVIGGIIYMFGDFRKNHK